MPRYHYFALLIFFFPSLAGSAQVIHGRVVNKGTQEALVYVNIGVIGTDVGAVSDEQGNFSLKKDGLPADGEVRFSMIGFFPRVFAMKDLTDNTTITLDENIIVLNEVGVTATKTKTVRLGDDTRSKRILTGWGGYGVGAGGERGIVINSKKFPVYPRSAGFFIARNAYDSVLFRLHIRKLENNIPTAEILPVNLFVTLRQASGLVTIDLSKYNLIIDAPVLLSVEWVRAWGRCSGPECFLQFSMNPFKGVFYHKEASDGEWVTMTHKGPGIFIDCGF